MRRGLGGRCAEIFPPRMPDACTRRRDCGVARVVDVLPAFTAGRRDEAYRRKLVGAGASGRRSRCMGRTKPAGISSCEPFIRVGVTPRPRPGQVAIEFPLGRWRGAVLQVGRHWLAPACALSKPMRTPDSASSAGEQTEAGAEAFLRPRKQQRRPTSAPRSLGAPSHVGGIASHTGGQGDHSPRRSGQVSASFLGHISWVWGHAPSRPREQQQGAAGILGNALHEGRDFQPAQLLAAFPRSRYSPPVACLLIGYVSRGCVDGCRLGRTTSHCHA